MKCDINGCYQCRIEEVKEKHKVKKHCDNCGIAKYPEEYENCPLCGRQFTPLPKKRNLVVVARLYEDCYRLKQRFPELSVLQIKAIDSAFDRFTMEIEVDKNGGITVKELNY